jgi:hypothetical protein
MTVVKIVTAPATATTTDLVSETHLPKPYDIVQGMEPMWTSHAKEFQKKVDSFLAEINYKIYGSVILHKVILWLSLGICIKRTV